MSSPPVPEPTPLTLPYWEGCDRGELRMQHCLRCDAPFFPPQIRCPRCVGAELEWRALSGRGVLHTYLIQHRPMPGFEDRVPYAVAIVQLDEGPRMMSSVVGVPQTPEALVLDMPLEVRFEARGDRSLPVFAPAGSA